VDWLEHELFTMNFETSGDLIELIKRNMIYLWMRMSLQIEAIDDDICMVCVNICDG
jgi:hypothetical protein